MLQKPDETCAESKLACDWATLEGTILTIFSEVNYTLKRKKSRMRDVPSHVDPRQNLAMGSTPLLHGHLWYAIPTAMCHPLISSSFDAKI